MVLCDVSALFLTGEGIFFCDLLGYRMFLGFMAGGIGDGKKANSSPALREDRQQQLQKRILRLRRRMITKKR